LFGAGDFALDSRILDTLIISRSHLDVYELPIAVGIVEPVDAYGRDSATKK
jgi:hypothetical protein